MKQYSFINKTQSASPKGLHGHAHQDTFFPLVQKFKVICPYAAERDIRRVITRVISELCAKPEFEDFLPMPPLWSQGKITQDENPNHYPKGSSNGGQFAPKKEGECSRPAEIQNISPQQGRAETSKTFSDPLDQSSSKNASPLSQPSDFGIEKYPQREIPGYSLSSSLPRHPYLHLLFQSGKTHFPAGSPQWLQSHEGVNGSHTIEKHVGKSIGYLKRRFKFNSRLDFASTFPDIETASKSIWKAIEENHDKIMKGLTKGSKKIEFEFDAGYPIGKVLKNDGGKLTENTSKIQVVLKSNEKTNTYFVYTAYPIL